MPPEGIDEASRAFQTEIAPASSRPRDEGGRFASATPRPEPMFEERPIEGDEVTGDTRDGGEDKALAAAERRIADGRAEEGDKERLRDAPARARQAAGDGGHPGKDIEPERVGSQDEPDQDAEERDEGADPERSSEQDPESRFKITTLDGKPVEKFEVQVDGESMEVTLDEALRGYVNEKKYHQRMNKVDLARQAVEQEAASTVQMRDAYAQKLQYFERVLGELTPPPPDWDKEFAADPRAAHEKQKAYATIYGKIQGVQQELANEATLRAQEYDRSTQAYATHQFTQFVTEANIRDEKALTAEMSAMRAYAKQRGFSEGEIATVYDKRMLQVLRDAAKYHQAMTARPKAVIPGKGKTLTPGVATPTGQGTRKSLDEAQQKLAKTGRLDDAAALFQRLIR